MFFFKISDNSLSYVISTHEAYETSTSEEISMSSQLPTTFKEHTRTETKEKKIKYK